MLDWREVFRRPWAGDNLEELPIRLPGVVLVDGRPTLTGPANPSGYAEVYRRWDLATFFELHALQAGDRRCRHCHVPIEGPPSKLFCGASCNHAARQSRLREKQQADGRPSPLQEDE